MRITICGLSGFVGSALDHYFQSMGHSVTGISIRSETEIERILNYVDGVDVVINLAGASILGRWTKSYKKTLLQSRIDTTEKLVEAIAHSVNPPALFLCASAVGVYDHYHQHDEYSTNFGDDFLANLVLSWEECALKAVSDRTRVCLTRFGVVYGMGGGAMDKMLPPFRLGLGGKMGDGFQMISWIHLEDLVRSIAFIIDHNEIKGIVNITSPEPISNIEQTKIMGEILHRPTFFGLPEWFIKLIFGEGSAVMLDSKEVYPRVLQERGFKFIYPTFKLAFEEIVNVKHLD